MPQFHMPATGLAAGKLVKIPADSDAADVVKAFKDYTDSLPAPAPGITPSATAPTGPVEGSGWFETTTGKLYVYSNGAWAEVGKTPVPNHHVLVLDKDPVPADFPAGATIVGKKDLGGGRWEVTADFTWDNSGILQGTGMPFVANLLEVKEFKDNQIANKSFAFGNAQKLTSIGNLDISNLTTLEGMFGYCFAFNQDISHWDTSNIDNMYKMFWGARVFNQDISGWNTSKVKKFGLMFQQTDQFNQDISGWNTSQAWDMTGMFKEALVFDQDLSGWDVPKVTTRGSDNGSDDQTGLVLGEPIAFDEKAGAWTGAGKGPDHSGRAASDPKWGRPVWPVPVVPTATVQEIIDAFVNHPVASDATVPNLGITLANLEETWAKANLSGDQALAVGESQSNHALADPMFAGIMDNKFINDILQNALGAGMKTTDVVDLDDAFLAKINYHVGSDVWVSPLVPAATTGGLWNGAAKFKLLTHWQDWLKPLLGR
jgi:surface protein